MSSRTNDPEQTPSTGLGHEAVWTLVLAGLGVFMTAMDNMVVTTALPVIRVSLHTSLSDLEWIVNAYILSFACCLLTGAALGDRFGRRRMFCGGLAVFTVASACAALSTSVGFLISARVVQGAGAAMVFPLTLTLINEAVPPEKRAMAVGIWGGIAGLAVAGGPVIGGAVVQGIRWHWIFWINVPVGVVVIPLVFTQIRESFGPRPRLDIVGLVLAGLGFLGLTWGLVRANVVGWSSTEVVLTMIAGAAFLGLFFGWERRTPRPMLELGLFRQVRFTTANASIFFLYASVFGALFLMAQFLQTVQHYSPLQAGIRLLPWTAAAMVASPIAGQLAGRYGNRPFMAIGLLLQAVGMAWIAAAATVQLSYAELGLALGVAGIGIGLAFPTVATEVISSVPPQEVGLASGTNSAIRELGGVFGVAVLATIFSRPDVYISGKIFVDGFTAALWVSVILSMLGFVAAITTMRRQATANHLEDLQINPATIS